MVDDDGAHLSGLHCGRHAWSDADHAACPTSGHGYGRAVVPGCRTGMAGPCNESPIMASLALQQMLLQSWNSKPIAIFPSIPPTWADARFARLRAEGAVLVSAVRANFTTHWFSLNATRGGTVSAHSAILDLVGSSREIDVVASPTEPAGVFDIKMAGGHPHRPWAAVFYSKAAGPPSAELLAMATQPLEAEPGSTNQWGTKVPVPLPPLLLGQRPGPHCHLHLHRCRRCHHAHRAGA